jgi:flavin-dependent thymidylate synthase
MTLSVLYTKTKQNPSAFLQEIYRTTDESELLKQIEFLPTIEESEEKKNVVKYLLSHSIESVRIAANLLDEENSHDNRVELIGTYGGDESHALSAWTSTSRELTDEKRGRIGKLLKQLGEQGHHSVFEKSTLHFLLTVDVVTHYQILKHRIGVSINAESARYKELKDDKFYVPSDWDAEEILSYIEHMENSLKKYHATLERLVKKGVSRKRAKESARFYIPCGNQLTMDCSFNFRSFAHFIGLRYSSHAQVEIRNVAHRMLELVKQNGNFDMSLEAFGFTIDGTIREPFE